MRKSIPALILILSTISLWSCQKEIDDTRKSSSGIILNTYLPLTSGTYWKLKDSASGTIQTNTVTAVTKTINNIVFTAVANDQSADTAYMANDGNNYYLYENVIAPNGNSAAVLLHYLNDSASVRQNWQYAAGSGNGYTINIKGEVIEKGVSINLNNKTYANVIHTRLHMSFDVLGTIVDVGYYDFYVAKGIGIVQVRTHLDFMGTTIQSLISLVDYHIR